MHAPAGIPDHEVVLVLFPVVVAALCAVIVAVTVLSRRGLLPPLDDTVPTSVLVTAVAVGLSVGAAAIHNAAIPAHFLEDPLIGIAFVVMAVLQLGWGLLYLATRSRVIALIGLLVNDAIVALWGWTRTVGLPFGPTPDQPEPVTFLDLTATFLEVLLIVLLAFRLAPQARRWLGRPLKFGDAAIITGFGAT
jgi:hypothetical protein